MNTATHTLTSFSNKIMISAGNYIGGNSVSDLFGFLTTSSTMIATYADDTTILASYLNPLVVSRKLQNMWMQYRNGYTSGKSKSTKNNQFTSR